MMNKKRTKEIGRTKYLMFLPLAALLMIISNIEAVARTTKEIATEVMEAVESPKAEVPVQSTPQRPEIAPILLERATSDSLIHEKDVVFEVVEHMPEFPNGGMGALIKFLSENLQYPAAAKEKGIQGRVTLQFIVNADGSISGTKVLRSVDPDLDKEAIRLINTMPNWKPGMQRGQAVRVKYTVPVMFRLTPDEKKPEQEYMPVNEQPSEVVAVGSAPTSPAELKGDVFEVVENMPEFPGGMGGLMQYISRNIKYPVEAQKAGIQGRVIIQIVVDKDGNAGHAKVIQGADPLLDAEALRLAGNMPKWKPGTQRGQAVNVKYTFPIMFRLQ